LTISISGPVMPLYVQSLGIDVVGWSLLATFAGVGTLILEWLWGFLSDRTDRRRLMLISILSMTCLFPLYTVQTLLCNLIVLQLLFGAVCVAIGPITRAYVSSESSVTSIGFFAGLWWAFYTLGRSIGPLLGTLSAQTWSFKHSFYASTGLSLITIVVILMFFPKDGRYRKKTSERIEFKTSLHTRSAWLVFLSGTTVMIGVALVRSFLPLYASEQMKMATVDVGVLLSATSAAQLCAMPLLGLMADRFGRKAIVLSGFGLSSSSLVLYFIAKTSSELLLVSLIVSVGLSASSLLLAMIPEVIPGVLYGTSVGLYGSFEDLGIIIGPLIFGFVWKTFGPVFIFAACSMAQVVGAFLVSAIHRSDDYLVTPYSEGVTSRLP
jgi:MFS family permease